MEFIKLNLGWDAEPNAPMPSVEVLQHSSAIRISFYLNSFIHNDVSEEDKGVLEFINCYKFRIGSTNDEGFYSGKCRFSNTGVKWGHFYRIVGSNWTTNFPSDEKVVDCILKNNQNLNHYLFYFRDETFECIAESYNFKISRNDIN